MAQYHLLVNLDKKEFVNGQRFGHGALLIDQFGTQRCTASALWLLVAASNAGGSGEFAVHPMIGRWAGDRIAVIGDGAQADDVLGVNAAEISEMINTRDDSYVDISDEANSLLDSVFGE